MKLDLRENMYIRTKDGIIDKILKLNKSYVKGVSQKDELYAYDIDNIVKASYNIIDLIEVGDIIATNNLCGEITKIDKENNRIYTTCYDGEYCSSEDIKEVLTREQFKASSYRIGD